MEKNRKDQVKQTSQFDSTREKLLNDVRKYEENWLVFLVRKSKLTALIIISLLVFGLVTITELPKELNPEVEIPVAVVATIFPGASPSDVEDQVTKEIENEISDLSGIKKLDSKSSLGFSSVVVEFEAGEDLEKSIKELKEKVDSAKSSLPEDANEPEVIEISIDDQPIVEIAITSDRYDVAELKKFAENVEDKVKGVPYVSDVVIVGGSERVVKIDLDQNELSKRGLSVQGIAEVLRANNVNFPLGSIDIDNSRYDIRVSGKFESAYEISQLPVGSSGSGEPILLEDVALVSDGFAKETSRSRFSVNGELPSDAVSLQIYKKTGGDVTKLAKQVVTRVENAKGISYPDDVEAVVTNDLSVFVTDSINTLFRNGGATVLLIFLLLFVFLGWKEALLAGPAIPFSFFIAFIIMALLGESLNTISLFSLVLSLGLLVDSAIVIVEGMYNKVAQHKLNGYQAAISTIKEYAAPLSSGMFTTVAAFFPLLFVIGIFGEFIRTIPVVVITTVVAGLFVSLSIIPAFGTYLIKPVRKKERKNGECGSITKFVRKIRKKIKSKPRKERIATKMFAKVNNFYCNKIPAILANRKKRITIIAGSWFMFVATLILPISGFLKIESFGVEDFGFFYINLEMPNGTVLDRTDEIMVKVEDELRKIDEVENFVTNVGASVGSQGASSSEGSSNRAFIQVNLVDEKEREIKSFDLVSDLRDKLENYITEGTVTFFEAESGPPTGSPVELRVLGPDLLVLEDLANQIVGEIENIPTTINVETSVNLSSGEFVFYPNKDLIFQRGLSVIQIAANLRGGIARDDSIEITKDGDEIKLDLGFEDERMTSIEEIKDLSIANQRGETFALTELGEIRFEPSLASISRRDNERAVTITADTDGGNPTEITSQLQERLKSFNLPNGYNITFGGEAQELQEVYVDMLLKMILGIIIILFILVLQFNSYKQAMIILFTIPLALIGVFWGMAIFRLTLDIPAFIGIVSLAGIVVNNAIILIDQINKEIAKGKNPILAAQTAGCVRMRPIFLTTITTIVGLLPLSITEPIWRNLGFAIIFGLAFSTLLTLILVPVSYVSLYRKKYNIN